MHEVQEAVQKADDIINSGPLDTWRHLRACDIYDANSTTGGHDVKQEKDVKQDKRKDKEEETQGVEAVSVQGEGNGVQGDEHGKGLNTTRKSRNNRGDGVSENGKGLNTTRKSRNNRGDVNRSSTKRDKSRNGGRQGRGGRAQGHGIQSGA